MKASISFRFLYIVAIALAVVFVTPSLSAQVDRSELGDLGPVEFVNYEGPYSIIETRAQIRSIGYTLGQAVKGGADRSGSAGRYFVIHAKGPADGFKLEADIFGLGVDVGVDHIKNLRLILQGYLEAAYSYTEKDAALLAEYITIYNAVYRGDWDYFNSRYKKQVMGSLSKEKAGLSVRFDEWPGQALIIIPLGTGMGGPLSSIDTTSISDSRVTEQLRQEPDKSIDSRKDMVDLKEREADQAGRQADVKREAIKQEEERIAKEKQQAQQQQQQARQQEQQARQEQQKVAQERQQKDADQKALDERQKAADEKAKQAEKEQQEARQKQEELNKQQKAAEEQKKEAEKQDAFADQKNSEAQQERQQIAQDQQSAITKQTPPDSSKDVLGVSILTPVSSLGRLVRLNPGTGSETLRSPLNTVNVRTVAQVNGRIIAIAGEARGSGAIRLVDINPNTLEMQKQGDNDISPQSLLWANGQDLYALITSDGGQYVARFNTDLALQSKSSVAVHAFASVLVSGNFVITQRADGSALLLNAKDLNEVK